MAPVPDSLGPEPVSRYDEEGTPASQVHARAQALWDSSEGELRRRDGEGQ